MAIRTGYQPAKLPQNQQWFQLPLDQMHNILSDAQTKADLARGEVDALSAQTFANLPQDEAGASEARQWLTASADRLVEQYGEDPRAWGAGLAKLRKEIQYRFDPNTGDIGKYQARVDNYKAMESQLRETYKDYPELANYAVSQIKISPFEQADKVNFGVNAPTMYQNIPEKDVNEFINTSVDNVMATEFERYGFQYYGSVDEFTKAYASGTLKGIPEEKVTTALMMQVPESYYTSYYQQAKARGLTEEQARQELNPTNEDGSLNPMNTMASKILGAAYGKAYQESNISYQTIKDDVALTRAKKASEDIKAQLLPWNFATMQYNYDAPWGTSKASIKEFVAKTDAQLNTAKDEVLMNLPENGRAQISASDIMNAERGTSADGTTTTWTITKADGSKQIIAASDGVMDSYKTTYTNAEVYKALALEADAQVERDAKKYVKDNYGKDIDNINLDSLPEIAGYDKKDALDIVSTYVDLNSQLSTSVSGSPYGSPTTISGLSSTNPTYVKAKENFEKLQATNPEAIDAYKEASRDNNNLVNIYNKKKSELYTQNAKIQLQGVSTTDFGGTGEENDKWQKDLQGIFNSYANIENFEVYTPGSSKPVTFKAAVAEAAKVKGIDFEDINLQDGQGIQLSGPIKRTMQPMPDGTFHWQASYAIKAGDKSVTINVLFPSDAGSSVSNSFLEALDNSPEARAIESLLYAKSFNLHEFKIPGTDMTIKGNGSYVNLHQEGNIYSDKPITYDEAKNILTVQYQIEEIQRANPGMTKEEAKAKYDYYLSLQNSGSSQSGLPAGPSLTTPVED